MKNLCLTVALLLAAVSSQDVYADTLRVAVASNFTVTAKKLIDEFERTTEHKVIMMVGSTGKQYTQIRAGLQVDVWLAADQHHPRRLEQEGMGVPDSRFTYAIGRLVLWAPGSNDVDQGALATMKQQRLAIANPKLAPYGLAALQTLTSLHLEQRLKPNIVYGENVTQAYQFVASGNAAFGLIARSQIDAAQTDYWLVPEALHTPIEQQAMILNNSDAARLFVQFLQSEKALAWIRADGYDTPDDIRR